MKREERNNDDGFDANDRNDPWKKGKQTYKNQSAKMSETANDQFEAYKLRQKTFEYHIKECVNKYDPIYPDRRLKLNDALYLLYDKNGKKWCFNLITLWPKFEVTNSYDIEGIYRHFGNIIMTLLDTKDAEFEITVKVFINIKKAYYKYAHNIDWNPKFVFQER